jgi:YD repeat-containing protein
MHGEAEWGCVLDRGDWTKVDGIVGYPLNISLLSHPAIGDFVPPSPQLGQSSVSLVDTAAKSEGTALPGFERPTLGGQVDLVTGLQIAQVNDLTLPLPGGEFRLIRTRSANRMGDFSSANQTEPDRWWDWTGEGWMSSENPILLIDSAVPDLVGSNARVTYLILDTFHSIPFQLIESNGEYEAPPRFRARMTHNGTFNSNDRSWTIRPTEFVIDLYDGSLTYTFRAVGRVVDNQFAPDDIPQNIWNMPTWLSEQPQLPPFVKRIGVSSRGISSLHERPLIPVEPATAGMQLRTWDGIRESNPGFGMPYYALCTNIKTKGGSTIKLFYCGMSQFRMAHETTTTSCDRTVSPLCSRCLQTCPSKGQISRVEIYADGIPQWILLYHYRVAGVEIDMDGTNETCLPFNINRALYDQYHQAYGRRVVNRIYAFKHTPAVAADIRLLESAFCVPGRHDFDHICLSNAVQAACLDASPEPLNSEHAVRTLSSLDGHDFSATEMDAWDRIGDLWVAEVRYAYGIKNVDQDGEGPLDPVSIIAPRPHLVKSTTREKLTNDPVGNATESRRIFAYEAVNINSMPDLKVGVVGNARDPNTSLMTAIFEEEDIQRAVRYIENERMRDVLNSVRENDASFASPSSGTQPINANDIALANLKREYGLYSSVLNIARRRWSNGEVPQERFEKTGISIGRPSINQIQQGNFVRGISSEQLVEEDRKGFYSTARLVSFVDDKGQAKILRINRLAVAPDGAGILADGYSANQLPRLTNTHRSQFVAPYQWRGFASGSGNAAAQTAPADHRQVRWISIIDEFTDTVEIEGSTSRVSSAWSNAVGGTYAGPYGLKRGQVSRRVVEVSGSGIVLRDTTWTMDPNAPNEMTMSGGGLGEQFIYESASAIFAGQGKPFPSPESLTPHPMAPYTGQNPVDPVGHLRNEVVLVEHRSAGWAAAEYGTTPGEGDSKGLVTGYQFVPVLYCKEVADPSPCNLGSSTQWYTNAVISLRLARSWIQSGRAYRDEMPSPMPRNTSGGSGGPVEFIQSQSAWTDPNFSGAVPSPYDVEVSVAYTDPVKASSPSGSAPALSAVLPNFADETSQPPVGMNVTYTVTWRNHSAEHAGKPLLERPVVSRLVIGPPRRQRPGESPWYYPVEREWYSDDGMMDWSASGLVRNPLAPASEIGAGSDEPDLQSLSFTRFIRDDRGQPMLTVADVDMSSPGGSLTLTGVAADLIGPGPFFIGSPPAMSGGGTWQRLPLQASAETYTPPLEYTTVYAYNGPEGRLSDVLFPNGRRWASRFVYITSEERELEEDNTLGTNGIACMPTQAPGVILRESFGDRGDPADESNEQNPPCAFKYKASLRWNSPLYASQVVRDALGDPIASPSASERYLTVHTKGLSREEFFAREYIFSDLELVSAGVYKSRVLGEIKDYASVRPTSTRSVRRVYFAVDDSTVCGATPVLLDLAGILPETQPRFIEEAQVQLGVDARGRVTNATLLEANDQGAMMSVGTKEVNDLLDIYREREIDGTVTRTTRNRFGQNLLSFVGSRDKTWAQGNYASQYEPPTVNVASGNDLVLTGRVSYGSSPNDAWLPTLSRRYTAHPEWALDADHFYGREPVADVEGYVTRTGYDWRMRPVIVEQYGEDSAGGRGNASGIPVLSTQLTFFDNADRPVLQVSYGEGKVTFPTNALNPELRTPADEAGGLPDPLDYIPASPASTLLRPLSVVAISYGADGGVVSRRTYNMAQRGEYHEELTLNGRGGVQVYSQRPGQPVTKSVVDGLARLQRTSQLGWRDGSWRQQLTRTDLTLDGDGNVVGTATFERVRMSSTAVDDALVAQSVDPNLPSEASNAVRRRSVAWFDPKKRNTATADLGTEAASGLYVASDPVYDWNAQHEPGIACTGPGGAPALSLSAEASVALAGSQISVSHYDLLTGRLTLTRSPDGTITQLDYDKAGRLSRRTENVSRLHGDKPRVTEYGYRFGRLVRITAYADHGPSGPLSPQVSRVSYGADILAEDAGLPGERAYVLASRRNDLIGAMSLPSPDRIGSTVKDEIILRYTFDGNIAERIDARGVAFRYFYDGLGRLRQIVVGRYDIDDSLDPATFSESFTDSISLSTGAPVDRIALIDYRYNARGQLSDVIAYTHRKGDVVSHNHYTYDLRGNLLSETQLHGSELAAGDDPALAPTVSYEWHYEKTTPTNASESSQIGFDRLASMTYPQFDSVPRRVVKMHYGASTTTTDHIISRLTRVSTGLLTNPSSPGSPLTSVQDVATFSYFGVSRRVGVDLGHGSAKVMQSFRLGTEVGAAGLDNFGRVIDLHYRNMLSPALPQATMFRGQYGYTTHGMRVFAKLTQAPVGSTPLSNVRSQFNTYNALGQLTSTSVGALGSSNTPPSNPIRSDTWSLDLLGNWNAGASTQQPLGRVSVGNLDGNFNSQLGLYNDFGGYEPWLAPNADGVADSRAIAHATNGRNEITSVQTVEGNVGVGTPTSSTTQQVHYDAGGNLLYDGTYIYQYDAWNRLIQVNRALSNTSLPITSTTPIGVLVKHFTYDGVGRLIRTQSPYPSPDYTASTGDIRSERFYYDGSRRIQEVVLDPTESFAMALMSGDPELAGDALDAITSQEESLGAGQVDLSVGSIAFEAGQLEGSPQPLNMGGIGSVPQQPLIEPHRLEREYIWGPGDSFAGVDELFALFGRDREPWSVLQDASGDVAALIGKQSNAQQGLALVAAQWTWDAYGNVLSADHLFNHPFMSVGHKGLFIERLDVGVADASVPGSQLADTPRIVPFAHTIFHNRNRTYNPQQGRFLQLDMNASGMALMEAAAFNGRGMGALSAAFDMQTRYGDGANLYQYLGSNPWQRFDPMGLSYDPFDMVDEIINERIGSAAALLQSIGQHAQSIAVVGAHILSYLPFPAASLAGELALAALGEQSDEAALAAAAMGLVPGGKLMGLVGKIMGGVGSAAWGAAKHYAMRGGNFLANKAEGLLARAKGWLNRKRADAGGSCPIRCFVAGTLVLTPLGPVPIESLCPGDLVVSFCEHTGNVQTNVVLDTVRVESAAILDLTLQHQHGGTEQLGTTDDHPFFVTLRANGDGVHGWVQASQLQGGDEVRTLDGTAIVYGIGFSNRWEPVYNLHIADTNTYFVGSGGVGVHNCGKWDAIRDYWGPKYGFKQAPRMEVRVRNIYTGLEETKLVTKTVHHKQPQRGGGSNELDNLQEVGPWEHAMLDSYYKWPYQVVSTIRFIPSY